MITWRDCLDLSRRRWRRKRIFSDLKYSAPLFLLTCLSIVVLNICGVLAQFLNDMMNDPVYPHPSHLRVVVPAKKEIFIPPHQQAELARQPGVREVLGGKPWVSNFFADFGEVRYMPLSDMCGYSKGLFDLYRTLPAAMGDPRSVPALLGVELLSLTWSPETKKFERHEKQEMQRWLGKTFTVHLNPLGTKNYEPKLTEEQLDHARSLAKIREGRRTSLLELDGKYDNIARRQDAVTVTIQVVGFITGTTTAIPLEIGEKIRELTALRFGRTYQPVSNDDVKVVNMIVDPPHQHQVAKMATSWGYEVHGRNFDSMTSKFLNSLQNSSELRVTLIVLTAMYTCVMLIVIYQLLSGQVKDSIREIGLLRCIGARRSDIMRVFAVMNMVRLGRIYLVCVGTSYLLLLGMGCWTAGMLNVITPKHLIDGNIPDFLIARIDHFSPAWLMGPWWLASVPLLLLMPVALAAAALPVLHVMRVQPSEALKD